MGQGLAVTDVEFTSNPLKFNNKIVTISLVKINLETTTPGPATIGSPSVGATVAPGPAAPGPKGIGAPVTRCNAPRGFRALDVDFLNDPSYNVCFFISDAMFMSLPKGQPSVNAQITFRGDNNFGYVVNMYKLK